MLLYSALIWNSILFLFSLHSTPALAFSTKIRIQNASRETDLLKSYCFAIQTLSYIYPYTMTDTRELLKMTEFVIGQRWYLRTLCYHILLPHISNPFKNWCSVSCLQLLLIIHSNLLLFLKCVFSAFQTDIPFSLKTFWFQKYAPGWESDCQKDVFAVGKSTSSLQVD